MGEQGVPVPSVTEDRAGQGSKVAFVGSEVGLCEGDRGHGVKQGQSEPPHAASEGAVAKQGTLPKAA